MSADPPEQPDASHDAQREGTAAPWLFGLAIVGSAFLIFLVQPMVAKRIVPWFGGTPAVWSLCLAFYQTVLFLGYAYAHGLIRWAPPALQVPIHGALLLGAALTLPILPSLDWATNDLSQPSRVIAKLLTFEVALPFMALAATGPLVQAWFARRFPERSPYFLYALSNAGSLAALLAYPFLIEPRWPLSAAGHGWGVGFVAVALAIFACAWLARHPNSASPSYEATNEPPPREDVLLWLLLPGAAVIVLMGVSNELCLDLASIPFLWVLPLAVYLTTFILCFASERWYARRTFVAITLGLVALDLATDLLETPLGLGTRPKDTALSMVAFYSLLLFSSCMVFHGELYRRTPQPRYLTAFYLCLSGGGALGGLFVGLASPRLFDAYPETTIGLGLGGIAVALSLLRHEPAKTPSTRRLRPAILGLAGLIVAGQFWSSLQIEEGTLLRERSFFGVLRVQQSGEGDRAFRRLMHGSTMHGSQLIGDEVRRVPTSYFGQATALNALMAIRPARPARVAIVGLGVGTIAAYGRPGDLFRYYEIDPAVVRIASPGGYFSFLADSAADVEVIVGDARLELEREQTANAQQAFDILIVDAFSSDSIPTHLLTVEAFEIYQRAIESSGIIALHCSNRHLGLLSIVSRVGLETGLHSLQTATLGSDRHQSQAGEWIFLSTDRSALENIRRALRQIHQQLHLPQENYRAGFATRELLVGTVLWTDDYTDLLGALKSR